MDTRVVANDHDSHSLKGLEDAEAVGQILLPSARGTDGGTCSHCARQGSCCNTNSN